MPLLIFSITLLALPLVRLFLASGKSEAGSAIYLDILRKPIYLNTLWLTVVVSLSVTFAALAVSTTAGMFFVAQPVLGRGILLSVMTLPLAFPGVVIGFLIILLGARQGLSNQIMPGHFLNNLPFMVRSILAVLAAMDLMTLEKGAASLGASSWQGSATLWCLTPCPVFWRARWPP